MPLDRLDFAILEALRRDARSPHAAIGRSLGLSGPAVLARVRKLEESGTILGYRAVVAEVGLRAIARVVTRPSPVGERAFEKFVEDDPRIEGCYDVDGEDSFILTIRCRDPKDLQELLRDVRSQPTVLRTITNIVLDVLKESR